VSNGPTRHLAAGRRAQLLDALRQQGTVRVSDLAAELGVTPVTVRRDLGQLVDEGLAERVHGGATAVRDAAPAPRPDPPAAVPPTGALGLLVPSLDYYWPSVARGAEQRAGENGLRLRLRGSSYETEDERPQLERLLTSGDGVQGILAAPSLDSPHAQDVLRWLSELDLPVVLLERTVAGAPQDVAMESVVTDHRVGAELAVQHLVGLGHRRIGVALSSHSPHAADLRQGWAAALARCGLGTRDVVDLDLPDRRAPDWQDRIEHVVEAALASGTTALLVHSDPEAMGVVQHCEERGVRVPDALSVVSYDDEVAGLFSPALTSVHPPRTWVGRAAVDLVLARRADPGRPLHRVVISPHLIVRDSTAPAA
jgi:DNA-binding LacI/PurR family transcriptional regulator